MVFDLKNSKNSIKVLFFPQKADATDFPTAKI